MMNPTAGFSKALDMRRVCETRRIKMFVLGLPARGFHGESAVCADSLQNQSSRSPRPPTGIFPIEPGADSRGIAVRQFRLG